MKLTKNILGVDAGFRNMGVVVWGGSSFIQAYVLSTKPTGAHYISESNAFRLVSLARRLATIIEDEKVERVIAELPTGASQSARAATSMAFGFAIVVLSCYFCGRSLITISPREVKQMIRSKGPVFKSEVIQWARQRFGNSLLDKISNSNREHVADAMLAVASYLGLKQ